MVLVLCLSLSVKRKMSQKENQGIFNIPKQEKPQGRIVLLSVLFYPTQGYCYGIES
jgi:hypothetical protein